MSVPDEWPPRSGAAMRRGHTEPGLQAGWHLFVDIVETATRRKGGLCGASARATFLAANPMWVSSSAIKLNMGKEAGAASDIVMMWSKSGVCVT